MRNQQKYSILTVVQIVCYSLCIGFFGTSQTDTTQSNFYFGIAVKKYNHKDYSDALTDLEKALSYDKNDSKIYKYKAFCEVELKKINEAILDFNQVLIANPSDPTCLFGRSKCYLDLDKNDAAIEGFTNYMKSNPNDPYANLQRGLAYFNTKQYIKAIKDFNAYDGKSTEVYPALFLDRGEAYLNTGNIDSAVADLDTYNQIYPDHNECLRNLAIAYARQDREGSPDIARKFFQQAIRVDSSDLDSYYEWGLMEGFEGNYTKSVELLRHVEANAEVERGDLYFHLASAEELSGDTTQALIHLNKTMQVDTSLISQVYLTRIMFLKGIPKYNKLVIDDLSHLIPRINSADSLNISDLCSMRGVLKSFEKDNSAIIDIDRAISLAPKEAVFHINKAVILHQLAYDSKSALDEADAGIKLDPNIWEAYFVKTMIYHDMKKKKHEACKSIKEAITKGGKIPKKMEKCYCHGKQVNLIGGMNLILLHRKNGLMTAQ